MTHPPHPHSGLYRPPDRPRTGRDLALGCGVGIGVGAVVGFVQIMAVNGRWTACDIGINASANAYALLFLYLPPLWAVNAVLFALVFTVTARFATKGAGLGAAVAAVLVVAFIATPMIAETGMRDDYPSTCNGTIVG
jgi:hypothetical protein